MLKFLFYLFSVLLVSYKSYALPIVFGINQGNLKYKVQKSKNFRVYHDSRVPHEGAMVSNALEGVKPTLDRWLGIKRDRPLPVIMSAATGGVSFADFIFDSIDLQTSGQVSRDLVWHELVHTSMYRHFDNIFGSVGNILHLPWMPAWFIEGLAESLSASGRGDVIASVERYFAVTGRWPSYDRLHSLYSQSTVVNEFYSVSGSFVSWILRTYPKVKLPRLLRRFDRYTYPQYFIWSFNPISDFLPFDEVLREMTGKIGRELYEDYKKAAKNHWIGAKKGEFLSQGKGARLNYQSFAGLQTTKNDAHLIFLDDGYKRLFKLKFDLNNGWLSDTKETKVKFESKGKSSIFYYRPNLGLEVGKKLYNKTNFRHDRIDVNEETKKRLKLKSRTIYQSKGVISQIYESFDEIVWIETQMERTKLCLLPKKQIKGRLPVRRKQVLCPLNYRMPRSLHLLGDLKKSASRMALYPPSKKPLKLSSEIWFTVKEQTLSGDRYTIKSYSPSKRTLKNINYQSGGIPIQMTEAGASKWLLLAEHDRRVLMKVDSLGMCLGVFDFEDLALQIAGLDDGSLLIDLFDGSFRSILKRRDDQLPLKACRTLSSPTSPLQWAMKRKGKVGLKLALNQTSIWEHSSKQNADQLSQRALVMSAPLDEGVLPNGKKGTKAKNRKSVAWQGGPVAILPWIGGDDPQAMQVGFISIPWADALQNEIVRATFLVSASQSLYPNTDILLRSTRFWPTIDWSLFRKKTWDGVDSELKISRYYDEIGSSLSVQFPWHFWGSGLTLGLGGKSSHLRMANFSDTRLNEFHGSMSFYTSLMSVGLSFNLRASIAPKSVNNYFDYHSFTGSMKLSRSLPFRSRLSLGLSGAATRGKQMHNLVLFYQPLRRFVPGTGGGQNKFQLPLPYGLFGRVSPQNLGLFAFSYGDTKIRNDLTWTVPIISNINKLFWILYFKRLNFAAFYNRGNAWKQGSNFSYRSLNTFSDSFAKAVIATHGYRLDLLFENKGVNLHLSFGGGEVLEHICYVGECRGKKEVRRPFESVFNVYAELGFDALF